MSVSSRAFSEEVASRGNQRLNDFHKLIKDLSDFLGSSSGLDSVEVDPEEIRKLMRSYTSNEKEWQQYALGDRSRTYTRNLVDHGNGKSDLVNLLYSNLVGDRTKWQKVDTCMVAR